MDYDDDYDFSDWFSDDYGSDYTPMEGNTTPDSGDYFDNAGGTYGDWSQGNYDYTYGNIYDYGNDYWNNLNNDVSSYGNLNTLRVTLNRVQPIPLSEAEDSFHS